MTPPELPPSPSPADIARLTRWVEDFERVVKDAWTRMETVLKSLDDQVENLDARLKSLESVRHTHATPTPTSTH